MSMTDVVQRFGLVDTRGEPVPLEGVTIGGEVLGGVASIEIVQRYRNAETRAVEAIYTFPLPTDASITGFSLHVGDKHLEGIVQEREEAFRAYDEALVAGHGAALLEEERPNIFTASVGNLLPGEETVITVRYLQTLRADEGALRLAVPTLVAPRYIPGALQGDRTAFGTAGPTDRVPDADRISPRTADVAYRVTLDLHWLGRGITLASPSHALLQRQDERGTHLAFEAGAVALDRDLIILAAGGDGELGQVVAHRAASAVEGTNQDGNEGFVALTLVPELVLPRQEGSAQGNVVFLLDRSGSMQGDAMTEARRALSLCLRHLRPGDRFGILAFDTIVERFSAQAAVFSQSTLSAADAFLAAVGARGGTELLAPLQEALTLAGRGGHVVLLTDGEVGNEEEIAAAVLPRAAAEGISIHAFAIGLNVSDALLSRLARQSGGAMASIYPGERIDEKVVSVFSRATAPRVRDLVVRFEGVEIEDIAPATLPPYVDGEPFSLIGRYLRPGTGSIVLSGTLGGVAYSKRVAVALPETARADALPALWAKARIRDLEDQSLDGRRADAMKKRIIELSLKYRVSSKHTAFVVIETRTGDRKVSEPAVARSIPVHAPATHVGSAASKGRPASAGPGGGGVGATRGFGVGGQHVNQTSPQRPAPPPSADVARSARRITAASVPPAMPAPMSPSPLSAAPLPSPRPAPAAPPAMAPPPPPPGAASPAAYQGGTRAGTLTGGPELREMLAKAKRAPAPAASDGGDDDDDFQTFVREEAPAPAPQKAVKRNAGQWLETQRALGLFEADSGPEALRATLLALSACLEEGIGTSHSVYGSQVKRALLSALTLLVGAARSRETEALAALLVLLAEGRITGREVREVVRREDASGRTALALDDPAALRALAATG